MDLSETKISGTQRGDCSSHDVVSEDELFISCFENTIRNFCDALGDDEKLSFQAFRKPDDVISYMRKHALEKPQLNGPLSKLCDSITSLSECLRPYFAAIDTLIQANPDITAVVWGALKFLFQASI